MNLGDNLKRIRKEQNLSQEQLAEKLGVSRQSVSKWESNLAYPEMEKVLQICKMFNLNIDDLMNQNIKEINENKQSKSNINKIIDDFLEYITKTIDLFSNMKFINKIKCLFEQLIIGIIIIFSLEIVGYVLMNVLSDIFRILPDNVYNLVYQITYDLYLLFAFILGLSILLYIFKVRYLDYYIIKENEKIELVNEEINSIQEENVIKLENDINKKDSLLKEKIIIRDPKHSGYKFISGLIKSLLFIMKIIVGIIASFGCISLIFLVIGLVISFLFVKTGLLFIGIFLIISSFITINLIVLNILYNFIINFKIKKKLLSSFFITALLSIGIGIGCCVISIKDFKYIDDLNNERYILDEISIGIDDNTYFLLVEDDDYYESNDNDIRIVYKHTKYFDLDLFEQNDGKVYLFLNQRIDNLFELVNNIIDDINKKIIFDYDNFDIKIYTSKENILKLRENKTRYLERYDMN